MLGRYLRLYRHFARNCLVREMTFRGNFLARVAVELVWFAMLFFFYEIIFLHRDRIGDWDKYQVFFLVATFFLIRALFEGLFLENCDRLAELVRTGELDFVLVKPVDSQFFVSTRYLDYACLPKGALALALCLFAAHRLGIAWNWATAGAFALLVLNGLLISYAIVFAFSTGAIWLVRNEGLLSFWHSLSGFSRLPRSIVPLWLNFLMTLVLPVLVIANFPAEVVVRSLDWRLGLAGLLVGLLCLWLVGRFWRFSLRHYRSASS